MLRQLLIVCPLVFLGALIDSIAGGGGLITLPAYHLAGLPPHMALGTNKFSSTLASGTGTLRFVRQKSIHYPTAIAAGILALAGSALGARLTALVSERGLQLVLLVALPVLAVFLLTRKNDLEASRPQLPDRQAVPVAALIGLVVGTYDGFFGPGTGTFLILLFVYAVGIPLRSAMGGARLVNFASNLAALATFATQGNVYYALAVPAAACSLLGSYIGAGLALRNGAKIFKPVLVVVLILLLLRIAGDLFHIV